MTERLPTNEQSFNQEFYEFLRDHLLKRPGMWVGRVSFDTVAAFINGMISAYGNMGHVPPLKDWDFQIFVCKKYGMSRAAVWTNAYVSMPSWNDKTEEARLQVLLDDFAEFANPLTRMVMGLDA